ncbi:MAG: pantetheine-phosphate adenylyltransferase [Thermoplasmata archaeon]|nr:pantetheine-phosphate adenylyltransferase [Thermoplasmata archaeon]
MRVAVGGTFHILHKGHKNLLNKAFEIGDEVLIGLTSDAFAKLTRNYQVNPYNVRYRNLVNFVKKFGKKYEIRMIEDHYGPTVNEEFDAIVVSYETRFYAKEINRIRKSKGLKEMEIYNIGRVLAEDLIPVASTRIVSGDIDKFGKRLKKIVINVGSDNEIKLNAVKKVFSKFFDDFEVLGKKIQGLKNQPYDNEIIYCAYKRAKEAIGDGDYGIGIEAGLVWDSYIKKYFDVHYVVILDKLGNVNFSRSMGFVYPDTFMEFFDDGEIGKRFDEYYGTEDIGRKRGAIGFLTNNKINREKLIEDALLLAIYQKGSKYYYL